MYRQSRIIRLALFALLFASFAASGAYAQSNLQPITTEDYAKWERLGFGGALSPNGNWLAYPIIRNNDENELRIHNVQTSALTVIPYGTRGVFSNDEKWLAYPIDVPVAEKKKLRKQKKPVQRDLGLMNLATGDTMRVKNIASFTFSDDGMFIVMRGYAPEGKKSKGVDIVVRDLASGSNMSFGNVAEYGWQKKGPLMAMIIDAEEKTGNGVQLFNPITGVLKTLESDDARYSGMVWQDKEDNLAVFKEIENKDFEDKNYTVLAWRNLEGTAQKRTFDPTNNTGFPQNNRIVNARRLQWSDDGSTVFFGTQYWRQKVEESKIDKDDRPNVEIWHAKDRRVIPEQKLRNTRERNRNYLAAWHVNSNTFVQLADDLTETVSLLQGHKLAIGIDNTPYEFDSMFGRRNNDMYLIDVADGNKTKVVDAVEYQFGGSPGNKYLLYLKNDNYWTYDITNDKHTNITARIKTSFVNKDYDHPVEQMPPYRLAGWTNNDASILIYDQYDIWDVKADGSGGIRLTNGAGDRVVHRYVRLDREEKFIDTTKPIHLSLYGEWSKKYGYAALENGKGTKNLVWLDKNVSRLTKAKNTENYAYVVQNFDDSPDYFVAGRNWSNPRQISNTNPFQKDYAWGKSELVNFKNKKGRELQGALFYPANYEEGKQYPMIVYIYEIRSHSARQYAVPSERSTYNPAVFTSEGYFVWQPDIVFENRDPGRSSIATIERSVKKIVETGMIRRESIGMVGHSWGGYQTAFAVTQTDIFAAAVAGAPLTNLVSMYGAVFWNNGIPESGHFEVGQERMDVPPWEDVDAYVRNSPVFNVKNLNTPLLLEVGDKDGNVDWRQGIEYYNAARRLGKQFVLLNYPGENHGLRIKPNQIDYHHRILQWFGHYLQGKPAQKWITDGLPYIEQQKLLKSGEKIDHKK